MIAGPVERAQRYLAKVPPSIQGAGGDRALFRAACALVKGFGLCEDDALSVLGEYNLRSRPPWAELDLRRKLRSALRTTGETGGLLAGKAQDFRQSVACTLSKRFNYAGPPAPDWSPKSRNQLERFPGMSCEVEATWEEGREYLLRSARTRAEIDRWRGWPSGTVNTLVEHGLLGCPIVYGVRGVAFAVQAPEANAGGITVRTVGFHCRHKAAPGQAARWSFHPNAKTGGPGCPALPFVLGGNSVASADIVVACEGQWDALTLAAAGGWLSNDASFPENVALFGVRGAGGWRHLVEYWACLCTSTARFILFPDADKAGDSWSKLGGFVEYLRVRGHHVSIRRVQEPGAKDLNDLHRASPLGPADVMELMRQSERGEF